MKLFYTLTILCSLGYVLSQEMTVCPLDVRQCPDGTWVGRTGSHCDFICPDGTTLPDNIPPDDGIVNPTPTDEQPVDAPICDPTPLTCPDGSVVYRSGPTCSYPTCPEVPTPQE